MVFQEMVPWKKGRQSIGIRNADDAFPLSSLQRRMNRMFDDFFGDFGDGGLNPLGVLGRSAADFAPRMDVSETDKEIVISAELAGIDQKDVDVTLQDDVLTIRGEKKIERDEKNGRYSLTERSCGTFSRSIVLPTEVEQDKIDASYKQGVLTIRLPKVPAPEPKTKKIEIKTQ